MRGDPRPCPIPLAFTHDLLPVIVVPLICPISSLTATEEHCHDFGSHVCRSDHCFGRESWFEGSAVWPSARAGRCGYHARRAAQCQFYVNWAGTASPNAGSGSQTEKLLAEPEVQEFVNGLSKVFVAYLRRQDEEAKKAATVTAGGPPAVPDAVATRTSANPAAEKSTSLPPAKESASNLPKADPHESQEKPPFKISAEDYGDFLNVFLTHPTAVFATMKIAPAKPTEKKVIANKPGGKKSEEKEAETSAAPDMEYQGGMVVSLGSDAARLQAKVVQYLEKAHQDGADSGFEQIQIDGHTWYRSKPSQPGDRNLVTFGFHGTYFVVGYGERAVEGILARWNSPAPAWLAKALEQTEVPRRTGIVYLNLKSLRELYLSLVPPKEKKIKENVLAVLELLGLNNVDSLVSTTGLVDDGMINRVLLALDDKPRGLLEMASDRPLAANDLTPIPHDALLGLVARVDFDRMLKVLIATYAKAGDADGKAIEEIEKAYGVDVRRFLSAVGDTWCVYNSPAEGELALFGWTVVVPVRDRAALLDTWAEFRAAQQKKQARKDDAKLKSKDGAKESADAPINVRTCRFAGHEINYVAGQPISPAIYFSDREMVMTLNMPAMKAYLARKDHRSLAALPGVALALNDPNRPVALAYCDTPRLFDFVYPLCSLYANLGAAAAQNEKFDLDPTFWPSAPAIRSHLRPEITTVKRMPLGLELTSRYCLPTGGASGPLWLMAMSGLGAASVNFPMSCLPHIVPSFSGDPVVPATGAAAGQSAPGAAADARTPVPAKGKPAATPQGTAPRKEAPKGETALPRPAVSSKK